MISSLGIDFDGVIHKYSKGWHDGSIYDGPVDGSLEALHHLMEKYAVFILTARNKYHVSWWLLEHGIPTYTEESRYELERKFWTQRGTVLVTNRKLPAVAYIDDRGIRFESWSQSLDVLERLYGGSENR